MLETQNFSVIEVVLNRPLFQVFDYKLAGSFIVKDIVGARVEVSIAGSKEIGIIYKVKATSDLAIEKLKVAVLLDDKDLFGKDIHEMLLFGSNYYHYPLGQCYATALPKLLREGKKAAYGEIPGLRLTEKGHENILFKSQAQQQIVDLLKDGALRRKELRERGFSAQTENALIKKGIIEKIDLASFLNEVKPSSEILKETPPTLNPEQDIAVA